MYCTGEQSFGNRPLDDNPRPREEGNTPPCLPARLDQQQKRSQEVASRPDLLLPLSSVNQASQRPARPTNENKATSTTEVATDAKTSRRPSLCRQEHVRQESWFPRESTPQPSEILSSGVLDYSSPTQENRDLRARSRMQEARVSLLHNRFHYLMYRFLVDLLLITCVQIPERRHLLPAPPLLRAQTSSDYEPWEHSRSSPNFNHRVHLAHVHLVAGGLLFRILQYHFPLSGYLLIQFFPHKFSPTQYFRSLFWDNKYFSPI